MSQAYGINGITDFNFNTSWPEIQLADKQDDPEIFIPPADNIEDRFPDTDDSRFMVRRNSAKPPAPVDDPPPAAVDMSKLGSPCGEAGLCEVGICAKYYGIAGPSGPEFSSCEISCDPGKGCPESTECATIADGPGAVCRMPAGEVTEPTAE